jgi:hypothetical protein
MSRMSDATPPTDVSARSPRRFRRLRIAASVSFACLTMALCVLWVRSYTWRDHWVKKIAPMRGIWVESAVGQFAVGTYPHKEFLMQSAAIEYHMVPTSADPCHPSDNRIGFKAYYGDGFAGVVVPHWLLILLSGAFASVLGIRRPVSFRFSLRTLLIATTLTAVALGLVCYTLR